MVEYNNMNLGFIPYMIAVMIFYDVSIHFIYLIKMVARSKTIET